MLHIMQTRNGTSAPDIVAMLHWAEANLDGRFLVVGVDKRLFDVHFPGQVNRYEVEERMRMRPFRFAVFSAADAETITAVSPAQIESVEVVPATSAHITDFLCNDFRRYHGVDADDGKITLAIVSSINEGLDGSLYEAVASRLNSLAGPTLERTSSFAARGVLRPRGGPPGGGHRPVRAAALRLAPHVTRYECRKLAVEIQRLGTVTLEGVDWDVNQPAYHGKFRPEGRQALPGHVPLRVVIGDDFRIEWKVADACDGSLAWPDPRSAVARAFPDEAVRRMIELLGELTERADQELASEVVRYAAIHEINHLKNAPIKLGISIEINRRLIESLPNVRMERADRERIEAETRADLERHEVELRNIEERRTERMATLVQINEAIIEWQFARFDRSKPRRPFMEIYEKATERRPLPAPR